MTAWSVGSSLPQVKGGLFEMSIVMWPHPGAQLSLTAESAAFVVGDIPRLSEVPPDYSDLDRAALGDEVAAWDSSFEPVSAIFLDPQPADHRTLGGG